MSRITETFQQCRRENRSALIGFMTGGDPTLDAGFTILDAACSAGLDLLELGVPFSDPTADGPTIQKANRRALAAGTTLAGILSLAEKIRTKYPALPMILFGYFNPFLAYGPERLIRDSLEIGLDGALCVDLPVERFCELADFIPKSASFDLIRLVAPTTTDERMEKILPDAGGFVYIQSRAGVTGVRGAQIGAQNEGADRKKNGDTNGFSDERLEFLRRQTARVRRWTDLPTAVGFGISTPEDVAGVSTCVDGAVVGSALVGTVERAAAQNGLFDEASAGESIRRLVASLRKSCG